MLRTDFFRRCGACYSSTKLIESVACGTHVYKPVASREVPIDGLAPERHEIALPRVQYRANRHLHMAVLKFIRPQQTDKMYRSRDGHRDVEELMRGAKNVAGAWIRTLRPLKLCSSSVSFEAAKKYDVAPEDGQELTKKATNPSAYMTPCANTHLMLTMSCMCSKPYISIPLPNGARADAA